MDRAFGPVEMAQIIDPASEVRNESAKDAAYQRGAIPQVGTSQRHRLGVGNFGSADLRPSGTEPVVVQGNLVTRPVKEGALPLQIRALIVRGVAESHQLGGCVSRRDTGMLDRHFSAGVRQE